MKLCEALRLCLLAAGILGTTVMSMPPEDFETARTSNAAILNRLGLMPMVIPDGHHRKRLAESFGARDVNSRLHPSSRRHNGSPHDSHVYVVKLPASPPYYSFSKPHADLNYSSVAKPNPGFRNNGKPAKIYHWNLPLVKKINEKKKQLALAKMDQARKKMEAERERLKVAEKMNYYKKLAQEQLVAEATQRKPTRNNDKWLNHPEQQESNRPKNSDDATQLKILPSKSAANDKIYRLSDERSGAGLHRNWHDNEVHLQQRTTLVVPKKHRKKSASVSYYYAPPVHHHHSGKSVSTSISKHFPGNGKPKAFYVMEKSRKPVYYHPLLP